MVVREISVSRSCRVNIGNYEGTEHSVHMKAELDELDDVRSSTAELSAHVERAMVEQLCRSYKVRGKKDMTAPRVAKHHGLTHAYK